MKLRIGLRLLWMNGRGYANFIGDHAVAAGWQKYLLRRPDVEAVYLAGPGDALPPDLHAVIHFHHDCERHATARNFYFCQNAWPRGIPLQIGPCEIRSFHGGTPEVFNFFKERFDGYLFPSAMLMAACLPAQAPAVPDGLRVPLVGSLANTVDYPEMATAARTDEKTARQSTGGVCRPAVVIPFAVDPERFFLQHDDRFSHDYAYVGSDIKGRDADNRYLVPFIDQGLVIYGGPRQDPRLEACRKGRVSEEDLPKVYSSAKVNLNYHMRIAAEFRVMNMRLYELAACGARFISDLLPDGFAYTPALDPKDPYQRVCVDEACRDHNVKEVLAKHTWANRMETLVSWLREVL